MIGPYRRLEMCSFEQIEPAFVKIAPRLSIPSITYLGVRGELV
jgi:hypothetical protein